MLHKCANSACPSLFRRLEEGKLFQVEIEPSPFPSSGRGTPQRQRTLRHVERFWLCEKCCSLLTLTFEKGRGIVTVPLPSGSRKRVSAAHVNELPLPSREISLAGSVAAH